MLPILPKMDSVGYWSLEVWGGATFDAALRFLDENPWERLRIIKQHCPKTPLQMLLRGSEPRRLPPLQRRDRAIASCRRRTATVSTCSASSTR